jgi:hypothetical protein
VSDPEWLRDRRDEAFRHDLDRRHPERPALRPRDVAGVLAGFDVVDGMWAPTVERVRRLPPSAAHERVDGEYSFLESLRHLLFAFDAWITRMVLGVPMAYHPVAVAPDGPGDPSFVRRAEERLDGGPDLDEVLEVRAERFVRARAWLGSASDDELRAETTPPDANGFPQGNPTALACFRLVLGEEWWHHQFAVRDLSVLEGRR